MQYHDTIEESAEYLRLALPIMSRQAAALHPVSYAVWYEYVSGRNALLKAAVDQLTQGGAVLDERTTAELFRRYIAELDEETAKRVSEGFQKVMADMSRSASQAGDRADQFGDVLEQWSKGLGQAEPAGMDAMLEATRTMQQSVTFMKGRLDESRREIEQLRQEVVRAREDSLADGLTGLKNRRAFDRTLAACLAPNGGGTPGLSLLMADIDHFKRVNDTYGHLFGDKVIRTVAQILKDNVKGRDTAARYGGEEFVVLLPDTPLQGAQQLAERIRSTIETCRIRRIDKDDVIGNITVSLGVACYRAGETANDFLARADGALYASKNQGRNRVTAAG